MKTFQVKDVVVTPDKGRTAVVQSLSGSNVLVKFEDDGTTKTFSTATLTKKA